MSALPNLQARSYRFEVNRSHIRARRDRAAQHVPLGGRCGYAIVDGRDLRPGIGEVVIEQGLARDWGLKVGDRLRVGRRAHPPIVASRCRSTTWPILARAACT